MKFKHNFKLFLVFLLVLVFLMPEIAEAKRKKRKARASKSKQAEEEFKITPEMKEIIKNYTFQKNQLAYNPEGRRDPFISLVEIGNKGDKDIDKPDDIRGMNISELSIKGVFRGGFGIFAVIEGSDGKTYISRVGDKVWDGDIKLIQSNSIIFEQQVYDELGNPKPPKIIEMKLYQEKEEE